MTTRLVLPEMVVESHSQRWWWKAKVWNLPFDYRYKSGRAYACLYKVMMRTDVAYAYSPFHSNWRVSLQCYDVYEIADSQERKKKRM